MSRTEENSLMEFQSKHGIKEVFSFDLSGNRGIQKDVKIWSSETTFGKTHYYLDIKAKRIKNNRILAFVTMRLDDFLIFINEFNRMNSFKHDIVKIQPDNSKKKRFIHFTQNEDKPYHFKLEIFDGNEKRSIDLITHDIRRLWELQDVIREKCPIYKIPLSK